MLSNCWVRRRSRLEGRESEREREGEREDQSIVLNTIITLLQALPKLINFESLGFLPAQSDHVD